MTYRMCNRGFLYVLLCFLIGGAMFSACIKDFKVSGLPCGGKGECSPGFRCYSVPDFGPLCLSNGDEFPLFRLDASTQPEPPATDGVEPPHDKQPESVIKDDAGPQDTRHEP